VIINNTVTNLLACVGLTVIVVILMQLLATILNLLWFKWDTRFDKKQKLKSTTEDVVEVKQGYWIKTDELAGIEFLKCSVCGNTHPRIRTEYCCDCGAKMDGERKCDDG
jgi:formate dehydrogenase maturation protein FdhE